MNRADIGPHVCRPKITNWIVFKWHKLFIPLVAKHVFGHATDPAVPYFTYSRPIYKRSHCFTTHPRVAPTVNCIPTALAFSILSTFVSSQHPCESLRSPPKCCSCGRHCGILCDRKYECGGVSCYVVTSVQVSIYRLILSYRSNAGYGRCNNVWSVTNVLQTQHIFELISVREAWVWISNYSSLCFMK